MRVTQWIVGAFALLVALSVHAQVKVVGDWHGVLQSPVGPMTLIVTIVEDEKGALGGELASPDQGPGKIPLTTVSTTDGHLAFMIKPAQISYDGEWVEAEQHWSGVFTQGGKMTLIFRRGLPPSRPVVEGLDGLWQGAVTRNGVALRLVLRVATTDRGTIVTFDSPDLGAVGLPVAGFFRRARDVGFTVPASGARFSGTVIDDGTRLKGRWTVPGQPDVEITFARTRATADGIGFIGHSEGGMVAQIAAVNNADLDFVVLLAAPGTNLMQLAQSQERLLGQSQGVSEEDHARMQPVMSAVFAAVAKSASAEEARTRVRALLTPGALATLKAPESRRELLVQQLANDWSRYLLQYAPASFLSRMRVPILALNGALDRQVPADENLSAIKTALAHNPDVTIRKLDGLNHLFQTARTGAMDRGAVQTKAQFGRPLAVGYLKNSSSTGLLRSNFV